MPRQSSTSQIAFGSASSLHCPKLTFFPSSWAGRRRTYGARAGKILVPRTVTTMLRTSFRRHSAVALLGLAALSACRDRTPEPDSSLSQDLAMAQRPGQTTTEFND